MTCEKSSTSGFVSRQRETGVTRKRPASSSKSTLVSQPNVRVTLKEATRSLLASRQSSCSRICSTVERRLSLKNGESFLAHSLQRLPSSSLRLPRRPISPPQMLQVFFSNIFPNSPIVTSPFPPARLPVFPTPVTTDCAARPTRTEVPRGPSEAAGHDMTSNRRAVTMRQRDCPFVSHAGDDEAVRDRVAGQAQDVVVAGLGENLRDVPLDRPSLR